MIPATDKNKVESGDFQTPLPLDMKAMSLLIHDWEINPIYSKK